MSKLLALGVLLGFFAVGAVAQPVQEVEPNNSFDTAQFLPDDFFDGYGAGAVEGHLGIGDLDYYAVYLPADVLFTAAVYDFTPDEPYDNDSIMGIFYPSGALFDYNDDGFDEGYMSAMDFIVPEAGWWRVALTGYPDYDFEGDHSEDFDYRLVMSIPEPATISLLLVGLGALVRRR